MPESEKRELGGLARSIDALFSKAPPAPAVEEPAPEEEGAAPADVEAPADAPEAEALADAPEVEAPAAAPEPDSRVEPDPFDSLDPLADPTSEPGPALSFADVAVPQEVVWESLPGETAAAEQPGGEEIGAEDTGLAGSGLEESGHEEPGHEEPSSEEPTFEGAGVDEVVPEEAHVQETPAAAPTTPGPVGPPDGALGEAVDAYLAGELGAAEEVEAIAAKLKERLALDPLADAVERLALHGGDTPNAGAIQLAIQVINPAVASRLVQRMGHEEDDDRRATYVTLSQRLGMVMAKAFRGALTDSTDGRARRAFYDGLIATGDAGRPIIEEMVEDDNRFLVQNAVAILGETGGDRAIELVTSALANTDYRVRREALSALAKLGGDESGQLVMASLEDPDFRVRAAAAEATGRLRVDRSLKPMLTLLEEAEKVDDLVQVLNGLGLLGDPGAVQAIEKKAVGSLFSKPPTEVRVAAYRALHAIGTPHARQVIDKAREDKDPVVRTTARALASEA